MSYFQKVEKAEDEPIFTTPITSLIVIAGLLWIVLWFSLCLILVRYGVHPTTEIDDTSESQPCNDFQLDIRIGHDEIESEFTDEPEITTVL